MLNSDISPKCPRNMVNFGPLTAEIGWRDWGTQANFNRFHILASLLHRCCSIELKNPLQDVWPSPGLLQCIYIFGGLTEFCQLQNSLCVQVSLSPILAALLHGTRAAAINQTLCRRTRNGIMELLQTAPPIFGWKAITLGIDRHSSKTLFIFCLST